MASDNAYTYSHISPAILLQNTESSKQWYVSHFMAYIQTFLISFMALLQLTDLMQNGQLLVTGIINYFHCKLPMPVKLLILFEARPSNQWDRPPDLATIIL